MLFQVPQWLELQVYTARSGLFFITLKKIHDYILARWPIPLFSTFKNLKQKDHHGFEASLSYTMSSKLAWAAK